VCFSPVPSQDAAGDSTKIVQRLPVRIALEPGREEAARLSAGMSVQPRIALNGAPGA
jgi:membrane fusion protein (multidrug efflux system)